MTTAPEFLDRHPWLAIVLMVLLPLIVHLPLWVSGRSTDPLWILAHVTGKAPELSGFPWTDVNVGVTSEALGRLAARDWIHGIVPWWNPFSGVGMPLAGELQPASFFLPFTLLFLLPEGLLWEKICIQVIAGLGTYALLRELGLSRLACLMGGALYALNGTISWSPGPAAVYCGLAFLPLQFLGIELARKATKGALSVIVFGVAIGWSLLAGFPEPPYIGGLLVLAWAIYRFFTTGRERWRIVRRTGLGFVLGLLIATPVLIAFLDYVRVSDSFSVHKFGENALPWAALSATLLPYIYGPVRGNYGSPRLEAIWLTIGGYCGVLLILLAISGLLARTRERGLRWLLTAWVLISIAKTIGLQPVHSITNYLPLLRQTQFFRYSQPSWVLALIILAAFGLDDFREASPKRRYAFSVVLGLVMIAAACAWPGRPYWARPHAREPLMFVFWGSALAWAMAGLLASLGAWTWMQGERRRVTLAALLVIDAAVMFMVPQLNSVHKGQVDSAAIDFLREHEGLSRTYALSLPLSPNFGAYFEVATINHDVLPAPKLWVDYIDRHLQPVSSGEYAGMVFSPEPGAAEQSISRDPSGVLDLSVRYLITNPGWTPGNKQFVPATGSRLGPAISLRSSLLYRLKFLSAILKWSHSVAEDEKKSTLERSIAKWNLRKIGWLEEEGGASKGGSSVDNSDSEKLKLEGGQAATVDIPAIPASPAGLPIRSVGIEILKQDEVPTGELQVEICITGKCASGHRSLSEFLNGTTLQVPLDASLVVENGTAIHMKIARTKGKNPLLIWLGPPAYTGQTVSGPSGVLPGHELHLTFEYGPELPGVKRVYSDSVMDIWELANAAPYFGVTRGGPCSVEATQREHVTVNCTHSATLRRRELYMPGWSVSVNGAKAVPVEQDGIFESTELAAGSSQARFKFVPPYEGIGLAAFLLGVAGMLWQLAVLLRGPRRGTGPA